MTDATATLLDEGVDKRKRTELSTNTHRLSTLMFIGEHMSIDETDVDIDDPALVR